MNNNETGLLDVGSKRKEEKIVCGVRCTGVDLPPLASSFLLLFLLLILISDPNLLLSPIKVFVVPKLAIAIVNAVSHLSFHSKLTQTILRVVSLLPCW